MITASMRPIHFSFKMNFEETAAFIYLLRLQKRKKIVRKKRFWVHPLIRTRSKNGMFKTFYNDLRKYKEKFFNYTRMSKESFDELLAILHESLKGIDTQMRRSISPEEKLLVTLRYLATGCSFVDLHFAYRLGITTVREIVLQVCEAVWKNLKDEYLPEPSKEYWQEIAEGFKNRANFPNCIGAIDGKHIRIIKPSHSGSINYNYKHYFSLLLLAVCDSDYKFIAINVGADGKESDSTVFKDSMFYKALQQNELNIPEKRPIPTSSTNEPMPYVLVGDEAFGLSEHVMRPYGGKHLTIKKKIFNYRLSRARRNIECTFGILANKWRIFHRPLNVKRSFAINIIKACCVLHNYVRTKDGYQFEHTLDPAETVGLYNTPIGYTERGSRSSVKYRDLFADFFENEGRVDWQNNYI